MTARTRNLCYALQNRIHRTLPKSSLTNHVRSPFLLSQRRVSTYEELYPVTEDAAKFEFDDPAFRGHRLGTPNLFAHATQKEVMDLYNQMFTIRRLELLCDDYYKKKKIWGFCHLYDGQEAVCCGIEAGLKQGDHIITAYRDHGYQYTRGDSVKGIFAEMFGKSSGSSRGKGGSMHLYYPENNFYGGNGIVGAHVPVGTGIALGSKLKRDGSIVVASFGDGAANQGQVYEAFNMAKLWNLPIIYVIENNHYGMGTATHRAAAVNQFYTRGDYIPGLQVDGMDVLKVREATRYAAHFVRSGNGPIVMEAMTYRYHGHSMSDPGISYRSNDEVQEYRSRFDPIRRVRNWILERDWSTEQDLKKMEKDIRKGVDAEAKLAAQDVELTADQLSLDIYKTGAPPFTRYSDFYDSLLDGKTHVRDVL